MSYLQHWGIKGQKWGVRRYQNEDGSLTSAGSSRYIDDPGDRFRWGQHVGEASPKMNAVAKVATTAGRVSNSLKRADTIAQNKSKVYRVAKQTGAIEAASNRIRNRRAESTTSRMESKRERPKMSSEQKKALAKKIAIGVGATALTAAAIYAASKGMDQYANKLIKETTDKAVTSFADQSMKAHTSRKGLLRRRSIDYNSVRREVEAYQRHAESGVKSAMGKKKNMFDSWQIIKAYRKKPVRVNYGSALNMLRLR